MTGRWDMTLLTLWLAILSLGVVMVASATVAMNDAYVVRHGAYVVVGLVVFVAMVVVPLRVWEQGHRLALLCAAALCVLVLIPGIGVETNGARRWIDLGVLTLQPSEMAKFLVPVYLAGYLARFDNRLSTDAMSLHRPLSIVALVSLLLLAEPDFGTVVVLGTTTCGMLFIAGARVRHFLALLAVAGALLAVLVLAQPYRLQRVIAFTDPWSFAFGSGYQLTQALIAFGRGEIAGLGLGEGIQKLFYLPEAHNDFIFAVIAEELGMLGAIAVIVLFAMIVIRIMHIARLSMEKDRRFGAYLAYGAGMLLAVQGCINMGVNTGLLPTKGLTLPFVSYGGNSLVVSCAMIGLVVRTRMELSSRG